MLEGQVLDLNTLQQQKDVLEKEAMLRNPATAYLVSDEEFDKSLMIWVGLLKTLQR